MVKQTAEEVRKGAHLVIFPEGTRTVLLPVNPLKGGCALIARQSGEPVQTVPANANTSCFGKRDSVFARPRFPLRYEARLGERLVFGETENTKDFLRRLEGVYVRGLPAPIPRRMSPPEPSPSRTHLLLIPTYNTGPKVLETVREALRHWAPVCVVVDGSTDGTGESLASLAKSEPHLRVLTLAQNAGKGAAVLHGLRAAEAEGFTHALTMDADGQHPAALIASFMETSAARPEALVLGLPQFAASAPALRVNGRKASNFWANVETLWAGIGDSLFGFRVYPIRPLRAVMEGTRWARRFDFDPEVAVRLCWRGVPPVNIPAPCRYFTAAEGGVSQFRYLRDNALLTWMHARLMIGFFLRLPVLLWRRLSSR